MDFYCEELEIVMMRQVVKTEQEALLTQVARCRR